MKKVKYAIVDESSPATAGQLKKLLAKAEANIANEKKNENKTGENPMAQQPDHESASIEGLIDQTLRTHQTVCFILVTDAYMSKSLERIQSLIGSLNRSPDVASGGTVKADFFVLKRTEKGNYTATRPNITNVETLLDVNPNYGSIDPDTVMQFAKNKWAMVLFAV